MDGIRILATGGGPEPGEIHHKPATVPKSRQEADCRGYVRSSARDMMCVCFDNYPTILWHIKWYFQPSNSLRILSNHLSGGETPV